MDIAVTTLVVLFALVPGLLFQRLYYIEPFSKQFNKRSGADLILSAFPLALMIHLAGLTYIHITMGFKISILVDMLLLPPDSDIHIKSLAYLSTKYLSILKYHLILWAFSAVAGYLTYVIVRFSHTDETTSLFRFDNYWHYVTKVVRKSGPVSFLISNSPTVDFTYVDALIEIAGHGVLYMGYLLDYEITKDSQLEVIKLIHVRRKIIYNSAGVPLKTKSTSIAGEILVIPYSEIKNLNFTYYQIRKEK